MNTVKYFKRTPTGTMLMRRVRVWAGRGGYGTLINVARRHRRPTVAEADFEMRGLGYSRERPRA